VLLVGVDGAKATWFVIAANLLGRSWPMAWGWSPKGDTDPGGGQQRGCAGATFAAGGCRRTGPLASA
jgi:hypothetical protein